MIKKLIVSILLLSHSFLAMAYVSEETKIELINFVKGNAKKVATIVLGNTYSSYTYISPEALTIDNFYTVAKLDFSDSNITYLPSNLYIFENLKEININNTNIEELPKEFGNMYKSWTLYASNAKLKNIPAEVFEGRISKIDAPNNQIEYLPDSFGKADLYYLDLSNNKLKKLPKEFGNIGLSRLYLNNNQLKELPDSFINLTSLRKLYLNDNQIEKLPKDFFKIFEPWHYEYGTLMTGAFLHLENNKISFFDKSICESSIYQDFIFSNNYIEKLPSCLKFYTNIYMNYITTTDGNKFAEDIIIYYKYEDNKTIKFEPIYQKKIYIESYLWNFGDGDISNEEISTHTYSNYGDYNVTLTINGDTNFSKLISLYPRVVELKKGWNLITPPTKDDINASIFEIVWSYESKEWDNNHSYLIPTIGYWVKLNEDLNYSYSGEVYETPNYKIKDGWNLIGSGEKMINFDENSTYYIFRDNSWIKNPKETKAGEGVWIKK